MLIKMENIEGPNSAGFSIEFVQPPNIMDFATNI